MSQAAQISPASDEFDPYAIPLEDIDMSNGDYFQNQQHFALFDRLRKEDPVHFCDSELIGRFKEQIQDYIAPQYKNGNRRTLQ